MSINWYPGHMVKARKEIVNNLKMVDIVAMLIDARAPLSCRNPDLEKLIKKKNLIIVMNKIDLADPDNAKRFAYQMRQQGLLVAMVNSINGKGNKEVVQLIRQAFHEEAEKLKNRGRRARAARVMVVGVPNVGKSTFLNSLVGKKMAQTGARPGVTRGKQWVRVREDIELMDTPGLMWPKIEDEEQGFKLALLDIVGENAYDEYEVALYMIKVLKNTVPDILKDRFKLASLDKTGEELMKDIAINRGHLIKGGEPDYNKTCKMLLQDFRKGKIARISLD